MPHLHRLALTAALLTSAALAAPVTITVWNQAGADGDALVAAASAYNKAHSDLQIKVVLQPSGDYFKTLPLAFQSRQAPDVFSSGLLDQFTKANYVLPLDGLVGAGILNAYKPYLTKSSGLVFGGKVYAIPTSAITVRLMYNRDLFRKAGLDPNRPPRTFSEVLADAQKITQGSGGGAYGFGVPLKWVGFSAFQLEPLILASNPDLTIFGLFNAQTGQYDTAKYAPAVSLFRDLIQKGYAFPGASSLDNDPMRAAFADGKIGMYIGASWDVDVMNSQYKTKVDWAAAPLPVQDGAKLVNSLTLANRPFSISAQTAHPKEAARVLEWLVGSQLSRDFQKQGLINSLNPAAHASAYTPQNLKGYASYVPGRTDRVALLAPTTSLKVQGKTYSDVLNELLLTDQPILPALQDVQARYNGFFKQAVADKSINPDDYTK